MYNDYGMMKQIANCKLKTDDRKYEGELYE